MESLARAAHRELRIYLVGGTTAVLLGWRASTIDVDLVVVPEDDGVMRSIPEMKERLSVNVELASPRDFIPVAAGWEERSPFIERIGSVTFHHFDLVSQALAKLERGHERDLADVRVMLDRRLVDGPQLLRQFALIEPDLYRFPAVDPRAFRRAVEDAAEVGREHRRTGSQLSD